MAMTSSTETQHRSLASRFPWSLLLLILGLAIPYGVAGLFGNADPNLSGLAHFHSGAESVYCFKGGSILPQIFAAELLILLAGLSMATLRAPLLDPSAESPYHLENGWLVLCVVALAAIPFFIAWNTDSSVCSRGKAYFWESVYIDVFILAILAISYNLLFGFSGIVSFGHAVFFGMGAYVTGILILRLGMPLWLSVLAALVMGVLLALIKAFVGLRIRGLYFALFTLAFAEVFFLLAGNRILVDVTGAEDGFTFPIPDLLNSTKNRFFFYYLTLLLLILAYVLVRRFMNSPTGRVLIAMRENEERAQMIGYNIFRFKLIALILSGILASGAGVLRGLLLKGVSPNVLGIDFTMEPLIMTIIGGMGTFIGPVLGAFGLRLTEQLLRDSVVTIGNLELHIGEHWSLVLGLIFVVIVIIFPQGIVGTLRRER